MGIIQTPWTQQPQQAVGIDWSNPITRGMLPIWSAINPTFLSSGASGSELAGSNLIAKLGVMRKWASSSDGVDFGNSKLALPTTGNHSCFAIVTWPSAAWKWAVHFQSGGDNIAFGKANDLVGATFPGVNDRYLFGFTPTAGRTYAIGFSFMRGSGFRLMAYEYETGSYFTSNGASITPATSTANTWIGRRSTTTGESWSGAGAGVALVAPFARDISESDFKSLAQNPWQIFKPLPRRIFVPVAAGGSDPTGSLNYTNNPQTLTASGGVGVGASASLSQVAQVLNGSGSVAIGATASITEAADSLSASGTVVNGVVATASITQAPQTVTSSGSVAIGATSSTTQAAQTVSASATVTGGNVTGTANLSTGAQTATTSGLIAITGAANLASVAQTLTASGIALSPVTGTANITPSAQTLNAVGGAFVPLTDSEKIDLILDILSNRQTLDPVTGTYTLYADDGVTVLKTALAWEDAAGTIKYRGQALQRLDALE